MPTGDGITVPLGLAGLEVLEQTTDAAGRLVVVVQYTRTAVPCPRCGRTTAKGYDRRAQHARDLPVREQAVRLRLMRRRFRCLWCVVRSRTGRRRPLVFSEPHEAFGQGPGGGTRRTTARLRQQVAMAAQHQTVQRVAHHYGVGPRFVRECFADVARARLGLGSADAELGTPPARTPRWLGIDDYARRKGRRYETLICDLTERRVLASVPDRDGAALQAWLEQLPDPWAVEAAVIDMSYAYRDAIELCLPRAAVVVDRFDVVRRVGEALDQVRLRLGRERGEERQGDLYQVRYALRRDPPALRGEERTQLRRLFAALPDLRQAGQLYHGFRRWYDAPDRPTAAQRLTAWEARVRASGLAEFLALVEGPQAMLVEWREEVLNFFAHRLTNGFVEGKHTRTTALLRQAFGYRNPVNLRLRIRLPAA